MNTLKTFVVGTPAPQGSKRHVGNGRMIESSKKVAPWRQAVAWELAQAKHGMFTGPVAANIVFYLARPKYHFGTGRNEGKLKDSAPIFSDKKPDLDKLLRSTLDAITTSGAVVDDAQIVLINAVKMYANPGQPTGALIELNVLDPSQLALVHQQGELAAQEELEAG